MKTTKLSRVLAVLLTVVMLAGSFTAFNVSAAKPEKAPTSKIDVLFSEEGYGLQNYTANSAAGAATRDNFYRASGIYYQGNANAKVVGYTKDADGKLTEGGSDYKLYVINSMGFFDPSAVGAGTTGLEESRYLNDILCSDVGYSKYTLEMDVAINNTVTGTSDSNSPQMDFSPYRGFSLLYLYSNGWTIKATGVGVGSSIEYDATKLYKKESETSFVEDEKGVFVKVDKVDTSGAVADRGYLYSPAMSSNYFTDDYEANAAIGTKRTDTFDIGGAIDFNKIAAAGLTPVSYYTGVEKTLKLVFTVDQKDGADNDVYNVDIYYDDQHLGSTSYVASKENKDVKHSIRFCDVSSGVTLDNIRLTVDETSEFRYHAPLSDYQNDWSLNYWDTQFRGVLRFSDFTNSYNNFSAKIYCPCCKEFDYVVADTAIQNGIVDIIGNKSTTIYDPYGIVKGTKDFFVATNLNTEADYAAPAEARSLINIGGTDVLKLGTDGKFALSNGASFGDALVAKNSYTVVVRVMPSINKYHVYVDGVMAGESDITKNSTAITFSAFDGIRLLCNKAVTVTTDTPSGNVGIYSLMGSSSNYCSTHTEPADKTRVFHKTPDISAPFSNSAGEATGAGSIVLHDLAYSYICTECGQRTYVETGDSIVNHFRPTNCSSVDKYTVKASKNDDAIFYIDALPKTTDNTSPAFWLSFDYYTGTATLTANDKNFINIMNGYGSHFRYYNSSSSGAYFGNKKAGGERIVSLQPNTTYKFTIRIHPSKSMDVWVDDKLVYSTTTIDNGQSNQIRFGMYGTGGTMSNISAVQEAHTCTTDVTSILQGRDTLSYSFNCCGKTNYKKINGLLADNIANVNDGFETVSFTSNSNYWIATDVNVRAAVNDGALITLGADKVLEIKDGKLTSGAWIGAAVASPTTYSVAANINGKAYDLYIDGKYVTSGTLSASGATEVVLGCDGFGYDVRFNYNKIVTIGNVTKKPTFKEDTVGTVCYHIGTEKVYEDFSTKLVPEKENGGNPNSTTNVNLLYTTYICKGCGERVYNAEQGENLHNVNSVYYDGNGNAKASVYNANETKYNGNTLNAMSIQNGGFTRSGVAHIYTNKDIIGNPDSDYWFSFSFDMTEINTENPRKNSGEANFLNVMVDYTSLLRIYTVPNTVTAETPISSFKTSGTDFKITDTEKCSKDFLLLRSKKTGQNIGLLYVGAHYDVTVHVVNGIANVYVNDKLMVTNAAFLGTTSADKVDRPYSFRFFDQVSGKYKFTNYAFVRDADSYVDFDGKGVIEADVTHTADAAATTYTDLFSVDGDSLLSVNDANGELLVPGANGYTSLYDHEGNKITVDTTATKIGLVNNGGKFNYYVNGVLARTVVPTEGVSVIYAQDLEPVTKTGMREIRLGNGVALTDNYGIGGTGTAEYIGHQMRMENEVFQNQIRIVAGLNSVYHGNVGFKVTNKTTNKEITTLTTDTNVYSSLLADAEKVYATDYGYNFFSLFEITDINTSLDSTNEISIIPYTTVGNVISYGAEEIITIKVSDKVLTIE